MPPIDESPWPDEIIEILEGDQTIIVAQVTPASGVVLAPVDNFGLSGTTLHLTSSLAASKKLERLEGNPKVGLAFHTRQHGRSHRPDFVLVQGIASFSWEPDKEWLEAAYRKRELVLGPAHIGGPFWTWWLGPFHWNRVRIDVRVERLMRWSDGRCEGEPDVYGPPLASDPPPSQRSPRNGTEPRINARRATRRLQKFNEVLLGWVDADGYPLVAPARVESGSTEGLVLCLPRRLVPAGRRRAGLTGHAFTEGSLGQHQRVHTGWLEVDEHGPGRGRYMPHTSFGYRLPPSRQLFRIVVGGIVRAGDVRTRWQRRKRRAAK